MRRVSAKLGNMRKPQAFTVYPVAEGATDITVQSGKSIGQFNRTTGKGLLNTKGCYFLHLNTFMGAKEYQFPESFMQECETVAAEMPTESGAIRII